MVSGANIASLIPTISISNLATISPESGIAQDFTDPFEYTVTAENGDEEIWTVTVDIETGIEENHITFSIFPNPSNGILNLKGFQNWSTLKVTDLSGKTVYTTENLGSQIDLSDLKKGVYFINISTSDKNFIEKVIIR